MARGDDFKWYKRNPTACLRGMRGLGASAIGCYNIILDLIYQDEDSCPNDAAFIGGILGESPRQTRALIQKLLDADKLELDGDKLRNSKAREVLEVRASVSQARVKSGGKGGRSPRAKSSDVSGNNDLAGAKQPNIEKTREDKTRKESIAGDPADRGSKRKSLVPDGFPHAAAKAAAVKFWSERGRHDLARSVNDQAEQFRDHHTGRGNKMLDWAATWRTWVRNAPQMTRPPANQAPPRVAAVEGVTVEGWVYRLTAWFVGHPDDPEKGTVGPRYWHGDWGPKPTDRAACKAPEEAWAEFNRRFPPGRVAAR